MLKDIRFRRAQVADAEFFFLLRNDTLTRAMSRQSHKLDWKEHEQWFLERINNPNFELYLVCDVNSEIGTVRVDCYSAVSEISWAIAPRDRGAGYGKAMLKQFIEFRPDNYLAVIRSDNKASCRIAEVAGFRQIKLESGYLHYANYESNTIS